MQHGKGTFQGSWDQSKTLTFQIHALRGQSRRSARPLRAERRLPCVYIPCNQCSRAVVVGARAVYAALRIGVV